MRLETVSLFNTMKKQLYYTVHIDRELLDSGLSYDTGWKTIYVYDVIDGEIVELQSLELELRENSEQAIIKELNLNLKKVELTQL